MNSMFQNKSNIHLVIAEMIAAYSHQTLVKSGNALMDERMGFFIVERILSTHFLEGYFCQGRIVYSGRYYFYQPNKYSRGDTVVKKILNPFSEIPHVKARRRRYYLKNVKKYEPVQNYGNLAFQPQNFF